MKSLHLRFNCEAVTPLHLGGWLAGSNLRGALGNVMQRAVCAETRRLPHPDPVHVATCPACWLLAAETDPGEVRRAYSMVAPFDASTIESYAEGQRFAFGLTLFGAGVQFLPYFVLAVPEIGRDGVGVGRGQFELRSITAHDPLSGEHRTVLAEGERMVYTPEVFVSHEAVWATATQALGDIQRGLVQLRFFTPMRLTLGDRHMAKIPDFGVLFARLFDRIEELHRQWDEVWWDMDVRELRALADQVRLVDAQVEWIDVFSGSSRLERKTPIGGFVGSATYHSYEWESLLPWLVWGQATQVGKDVVKGNGWYEISAPSARRYGRWISDPS